MVVVEEKQKSPVFITAGHSHAKQVENDRNRRRETEEKNKKYKKLMMTHSKHAVITLVMMMTQMCVIFITEHYLQQISIRRM